MKFAGVGELQPMKCSPRGGVEALMIVDGQFSKIQMAKHILIVRFSYPTVINIDIVGTGQ